MTLLNQQEIFPWQTYRLSWEMSAQVPTKIVLKSTTKMSLNDRWERVPQVFDLWHTRRSTGGPMSVCEGRGETWSPFEVPARFHPALFCFVATPFWCVMIESNIPYHKVMVQHSPLGQADNHWFICEGIGEMWFLTKWEPFVFQHALFLLRSIMHRAVWWGNSLMVKLIGVSLSISAWNLKVQGWGRGEVHGCSSVRGHAKLVLWEHRMRRMWRIRGEKTGTRCAVFCMPLED